jgi:hypothetical protein
MPIGPVTTPPREISVAEPVSPALERVKRVLFRPFDLGKWFIIGFCAWLAQLGEGGFGGNYNFGPHQGTNSGDSFRHSFERARDYVLDNLNWIVPLAAGLVVIFLSLWLLFLWLNSRGKFTNSCSCTVWPWTRLKWRNPGINLPPKETASFCSGSCSGWSP